MYKERRVFTRLDLQTNAFVIVDNKKYPVCLVNFSLQGLMVETENEIPLRKGYQCLAEVLLPENENLTIEVLTVHHQTNKIGFSFCENTKEVEVAILKLFESNYETVEA